MPETVSDWVTSLFALILIAISGLYAAVSALRGRARRRDGRPVPGAYPGSREHTADLNLAWWRLLPTAVQARYDAEAIGPVEEAKANAEDAARVAVERATQINTLARF